MSEAQKATANEVPSTWEETSGEARHSLLHTALAHFPTRPGCLPPGPHTHLPSTTCPLNIVFLCWNVLCGPHGPVNSGHPSTFSWRIMSPRKSFLPPHPKTLPLSSTGELSSYTVCVVELIGKTIHVTTFLHRRLEKQLVSFFYGSTGKGSGNGCKTDPSTPATTTSIISLSY